MSLETHDAGRAARNAHEWLVEGPIFNNIILHAGQYSGKYKTNVSLASHIVNATLIGVNCFIYDAIAQAGKDIHDLDEEFRILAAALVLHDANKYVNSKYNEDVRDNAQAVLNKYFEGDDSNEEDDGDDFGIEEFLGDEYRDDLLYLIQRTEVYEDSSESRGSETEFRGLERYCRLGDTTASRILNNGLESGVEYLKQNYSLADSNPVQLVEFTTLEQPVLNDLLVSSVKRVIAGDANEVDSAHGVVLGSTTDSVLYLGDSVERTELRRLVDDDVRTLIGKFGFSCKLNWNSFDYDILAEIGIPVSKKETIIADSFRDLLGRGSAGVEGFEYIDPKFDRYFPILAKAIYLNKQTEFSDLDVQEAYDEIREEQGSQKAKLHFIAHLVRTCPEYEEFLDALREELVEDLHDDLEPKSDAIGTVVRRFFEGTQTPVLGSKDEMCFLCGARTNTKYQKGPRALYRTQEYSRRVPPHKKYKSICGVCNLEYALFADVCERHDVSTSNNVELAYFYFDEFLGDIRLRGTERMGNPVQGETIDLGELDLTTQFVGPQYFLQPVYILNTNHRMAVVRQIMRMARNVGMKVVIGRPFTRFEAVDEVFRDEEATRPQELLELDAVERFEDFDQPLALFHIMSMIGQETGMKNPYLQLDRDTFHDIAHFVVVNHDAATRLGAVQSYFETYHRNELMQMKDVARSGKTLYGQHRFGSKYKKTRVFREAIHAFLSGMNQGMDDETITEYVESQVYATAKREQFAGRVTTEQASDFVSSVYQYLDENDLYSLKKLSDWENALVNSYFYAFDQLSSEQ